MIDGNAIYTQSDATLEIPARLNPPWSWISLLRIIPSERARPATASSHAIGTDGSDELKRARPDQRTSGRDSWNKPAGTRRSRRPCSRRIRLAKSRNFTILRTLDSRERALKPRSPRGFWQFAAWHGRCCSCFTQSPLRQEWNARTASLKRGLSGAETAAVPRPLPVAVGASKDKRELLLWQTKYHGCVRPAPNWR
jgi:hypothetical protein